MACSLPVFLHHMTKVFSLGKGVFLQELVYYVKQQKHEVQFGSASISVSPVLQSP